MSPRPTAASPNVWSVANRLLLGSTVSSRNLLYQSTGLPAANSATRLGWKARKRGDTVGYGITPQRYARVSLVHTALTNHAPTTTRSRTIHRSAPIMAMKRHATGPGGRGQRRPAAGDSPDIRSAL